MTQFEEDEGAIERKILREYYKKIGPDGKITWVKKRNPYTTKSKNTEMVQGAAVRGEYAGECPLCHSSLVWREARETGELYRGCTNYEEGCRWNDRSY